MEILVSGLEESAGLQSARALVGVGPDLRWVEPGDLEQATGMEQALTGHDLVWTYSLPWRYVALAGEAGSQALDRWLSANRQALNAKRVLGARLSFAANTGTVAPEPQDALFGVLAARLMPEIDEVLCVLRASDRSRAAADAVLAAGDARKWFLSFCQLLANDHRQAGEGAEVGLEALVADLMKEREVHVAAESAHKHLVATVEAELRETQAVLEQQYLAAHESGVQLASEKRARAAAESACQDTKKALERAQAELASARAALAHERAKLSQSLAAGEEVIAERAARATLEREREVLLQRIEATSAALARQQERTAALEANARLAATDWIPGKVRRAARRALRASAPQGEAARQLHRIAESEWFDRAWYLERYPDVRMAGADPAEHYFMHGWKEGRDPGPRFDTLHYLDGNHDVRTSGMNPLWHFIEFGIAEGRTPSPVKADAPGEAVSGAHGRQRGRD